MNEVAFWLMQTTVVLSLLVVVVLLLRRPLARLTSARWSYLIWSMPAAYLLVSALPAEVSGIAANVTGPLAIDPLPLANALPAWVSMTVVAIWLSGAVLVFGAVVTQQLGCRRALLQGSRELKGSERKHLAEQCRRMLIFPQVQCRVVADLQGPALLGLIRPVLLLPADFFSKCPAPDLVLRHELVHYKRRDHWSNALVALLRCLFWFNPLMWLAENKFRDDQEVACDHAVMAEQPGSRRRQYGLAMIASAVPRSANVAAFMATSSVLKRRAGLLARHKTTVGDDVLGFVLVLALVVVGVGVGADATATDLALIQPLQWASPVPGSCGGTMWD